MSLKELFDKAINTPIDWEWVGNMAVAAVSIWIILIACILFAVYWFIVRKL